jgi:hypothetical protein
MFIHMETILNSSLKKAAFLQKCCNLFLSSILFVPFFPAALLATNKLNYNNQNNLFSAENKYQPYIEIGGVKYFNQNSTVAGIL